uniref:Uncharacterized protein n=1 Tax=Picea glauca TaxID=3330 RepID=A0A101LYD4_PICGL|nr:hypothetical protein ABT39_MTgene5828 [Picea glauca]QHR92310.1 hypothetical protein Q903MT_gene6352 [Picea sitchensis]
MELDLQSMELHMDLLLLALDTELDHQLVDLHLHLERLLLNAFASTSAGSDASDTRSNASTRVTRSSYGESTSNQ